MMRPLPIAACLAIAVAAFAASAQDTSEAPEPTIEPAADAPAETAPADVAPAADAVAADSTTQTATEPAVVGSIDAGRKLTFTCMGCHGIPGYENAYPTYHVPRIGGQSAQYLVNALTEYQQGQRQHPTMQAQAESFSEQQIADIAAYLSSLK